MFLIGKDIFSFSKIFVPINIKGKHWTLAVIFMEEMIIQYYDSLGSSRVDYLTFLLQYVMDVHSSKNNTVQDVNLCNSWKLVPCTKETPKQFNGVDCGVFICMFADFLSNNCPFHGLNVERDIPLYRKHIALSILSTDTLSHYN
jgi:sentrin-specific protease 1